MENQNFHAKHLYLSPTEVTRWSLKQFPGLNTGSNPSEKTHTVFWSKFQKTKTTTGLIRFFAEDPPITVQDTMHDACWV